MTDVTMNESEHKVPDVNTRSLMRPIIAVGSCKVKMNITAWLQ